MFVFQAAHTWTKARVPRFRSQPDLYVRLHLVVSGSISSIKSCFPLFRSIVRCCSFIDFRLHWTSLSSSVLEPTIACRCSNSFYQVFVVCLCNFRGGELATLGEVHRECSTCDANFFSCGDAVSTVLHDGQHRPLAVLFVVGTHPFVCLPSVSFELQDCLP